MKDIFSEIKNWSTAGKKFAIATVIKTWGSAPRLVGASMAISADEEILGSVSGGCVEGAVVKAALAIIESGVPKLLHFGVSDEDAWAVGLSCGGKIDVFVEPFIKTKNDPVENLIWEKLAIAIDNNNGCVLLSRLSEEQSAHVFINANGSFIKNLEADSLIEKGLRAYKERKNQIIEDLGVSYFAQVFQAKSKLIVIGAAHISVDLVDLANQFGFETIVIDPRGLFTNKTQFINAPNQMYKKWPAEVLPNLSLDAYTYAVMLTHDPKIDDQALHIFLKSEVAYIGALGSRKTAAKRVNRLKEAGFSEAEIARIHGPVGINIHAKKPKEIALSILAEIISVKNEFL
ncbi:MAG TPA: XdhC family protein [Phaeodactylibacter sp.]|nr:XdhC family protein [Phaeodactylibacter sp.]